MTDSSPPRSAKIPPGALPRSEEGRLDWLRLIRSRRVGPATFIRLIRQFGSARGALDALPAIAAESGVRDYAPASRSEVEAEWRAAAAAGAAPLLLGGPGYPALLATIADPPPFLWAMGSEELCGQRSVALVGARNASALGCRMAARLATDLGGMGFAIVSGLARGIDAAAHRAALATGTIAVQAGGVDVVYPAENGGLAASIAESGLRLSEMPIGHAPRPQDFPRRNRIVSGLAEGIVVVEGALRSGSLITARNALDQGREVMAVPGSPMDPRAGGCNALIRDGATLVRDAADVAEALAAAGGTALPAAAPRREEAPAAAPAGSEGRLLDLLGPAPVAEDLLIRELGCPAAALAAALIDLELAGLVQRHPGGLVSRVPG
ncbi:MAG TPA: DNA-processing protein DprA [Amaricoccus sp.]|uniref:DNA-processing protein DprA n=1 Tax=Amaricoccus sp. TaxID=1872485 RepID=UPI002D14E0B2|nr:DNA-processing protein DprA [Amaricoccus sp.]HMQ95580.1 DNA-processing protein DprA [Amaricoccus sp.]HMR52632.1 DNA-processing protein DprA [Amaricoccus sp.]HMR61865.1 DNA-processing protein DprA [Amaricoccus sp.]HMT99596.1 DNA-processing protein DprA [Amaricoccus sp.]